MDSGLLSLIPLNSKSLCENLIADECVNINVVEPRKSKYGDFRFKVNNTPSININRTNNCYKFLLIFLHVCKNFKSDISALMLIFFLRWTIFLVGCMLILNDDPANKLMAVGVLIFIMSFTKLKDTQGNL